MGSPSAVCYKMKNVKRFHVAVALLGICSLAIGYWFLSTTMGTYSGIPLSIYAEMSVKYDDIINDVIATLNDFRTRKLRSLPPKLQEKLQHKLKLARDRKIILMWVPGYHGAIRSDDLDDEKCGRCAITGDRGKINDKNVGAVVYHWDKFSIADTPKRNPNHLHVYWCMESPAALKNSRDMSMEEEDLFQFNATLTYRRTSDFFQPYRDKTFSEQSMGKKESYVQELIKNKTKFGVAMVSNCDFTPGAYKRLKLLRQLLSSDLKIDAFGACFHRSLDFGGFQAKLSEYKFFFAFENSHHCNDYITEKFFDHSLLRGSVAVVWGGKKSDYKALGPPGSFIFAEDFESMSHLAAYLNLLNEDDEGYAIYHRWRTLKREAFEEERAEKFCSLCRALHGINVDEYFRPDYGTRQPAIPLFSNSVAKRSVSLRKLFYDTESRECLTKS